MGATGADDRRRWVLSVLEELELPLTRYAVRLLGDEDAARDVVQHAFLRLCDQSPEELAGRVRPWMFRVCRNRAVDMLRADRRTASLGDCRGPACPSEASDPATVAQKQELYRRLGQLVAQLPAGQREAIDLWAEGFTYREIAEITGSSEGSVRVLVHRALKRLRESPLARQLLDPSNHPISTQP